MLLNETGSQKLGGHILVGLQCGTPTLGITNVM